MRAIRLLLAAVAFTAAPTSLLAGFVGYTDQAAFTAALPGPASVFDFESFTAGDVLGDGVDVGGLMFNYGPDFSGEQLIVSDVFDTTSGTNFLGTDLDDLLAEDFNDFSITFASAVHAVGMYFITGADAPLFDGDITLDNGNGSVSLVALDVFQLSGGDNVYFLGLTDTSAFTTVSIATPGLGGAFLYNVDDIVTARRTGDPQPVPEPSALALMSLGAVATGFVARRRRTA